MKPVPKKKKVVRRAPAERTGERYVSESEANEMFLYYCQTKGAGGILGVARKFNRARSTIIHLAERQKWDERSQKILADVRNAVDQKIVKKEISNLEIVRSIKSLSAKQVLQGIRDKTLAVSVRDALAAIAAEEELLEKLPEGSKPLEHNPEEIQKAVELLSTFDGDMLRKVGDYIGSRKIPIEQLTGDSSKRQNE